MQTAPLTAELPGRVEPVRVAQVRARVTGIVQKRLFNEGSQVKAGQALFQIDRAPYEAAVDSAKAALAKARVDSDELQRDFDRKTQLVARQFIAASEAEKAQALARSGVENVKLVAAQLQSAQAGVAQREAALAQARIDLERTRITSPVSGIVIKRAIEKGQTVAASSPGWTQSAQGARFAWARYSAALALPTITTTGSPTTTWHMAAWRPAQASSFGVQVHQDGSPPAATSITATTQTLLVLFGWAVGDQAAQWTFEGASWATLASVSGQGTGNSNFANVGIAWAQAASGDALTGLRAKLVSNRYFLLSVGERAGGLFFGA